MKAGVLGHPGPLYACGEGNDGLEGDDRFAAPPGRVPPMRGELCCGPGKDQYHADRLDYLDSNCEEKFKPGPLIP